MFNRMHAYESLGQIISGFPLEGKKKKNKPSKRRWNVLYNTASNQNVDIAADCSAS